MSVVSNAEGDAFVLTRIGAALVWPSTEPEKTAALSTAEVDLGLYYTLDATDADHKRAVFEQAVFRLMDSGIDRRSGLATQGVASAGVVKEAYRDGGGGVPVCAYARAILGEPVGVAGAVDLDLIDE